MKSTPTVKHLSQRCTVTARPETAQSAIDISSNCKLTHMQTLLSSRSVCHGSLTLKMFKGLFSNAYTSYKV